MTQAAQKFQSLLHERETVVSEYLDRLNSMQRDLDEGLADVQQLLVTLESLDQITQQTTDPGHRELLLTMRRSYEPGIAAAREYLSKAPATLQFIQSNLRDLTQNSRQFVSNLSVLAAAAQ